MSNAVARTKHAFNGVLRLVPEIGAKEKTVAKNVLDKYMELVEGKATNHEIRNYGALFLFRRPIIR